MRRLVAAVLLGSLFPLQTAVAAKSAPKASFPGTTLEGVFMAYPNLVRMTLELQPQASGATNQFAGKLRLEPVVTQRFVQPGPTGIVDATLDYDAATGIFTLTPAAAGARQLGAQVPTFTGVVDADSVVGAGTASGKRGECPYFVLAPSSVARATFLANSGGGGGGPSLISGLAVKFGGGNADKIKLWAVRLEDEYPKVDMRHTQINMLFDVGRVLFRDDHFVKYFGKRYDQMSKNQLLGIRTTIQQLPMPRANFPEERGNGAALALMNAFASDANIADLRLSVAAFRPMTAWRTRALARIAAMPATADTWRAVHQLEAVDKTTLASFWPSEHASLSTAVADVRGRIAPTLLSQEVEAQLGKATGYASVSDLGNLLGSMKASPLAPGEIAEPRMLIAFVPDSQRQALESKLSERRIQLVSAEVASRVASAAGYEGLQNLYITRGTVQSIFSMSPAEQSAGQPVIVSLDAKIRELVAGQVATESADYQAFIGSSAGDATTLAEANARELRIREAYSAFVKGPEFAGFNELRARHRGELLTRNAGAIAARMTAAQRMSEVREIHARHVLDQDAASPAAQPLQVALRERAKVLEPFASLPGGDYLDLIYDGDYQGLRAMDMEYVAGLRSLLDYFVQGIGRYVGISYDDLSMLPPVMTAYLTSYQSRYAKCLRNDRVKFVISGRTPDYVTTNGWGVEISRIYGHAYENHYVVNREFARAFAILGDGDSGGLMLTDVFLNQGRITKLLMGTEQMMRQFDCADPRIKRLEANMVKLYDLL